MGIRKGAGVTLPSHTSLSEETLGVIQARFAAVPGLQLIFEQ